MKIFAVIIGAFFLVTASDAQATMITYVDGTQASYASVAAKKVQEGRNYVDQAVETAKSADTTGYPYYQKGMNSMVKSGIDKITPSSMSVASNPCSAEGVGGPFSFMSKAMSWTKSTLSDGLGSVLSGNPSAVSENFVIDSNDKDLSPEKINEIRQNSRSLTNETSNNTIAASTEVMNASSQAKEAQQCARKSSEKALNQGEDAQNQTEAGLAMLEMDMVLLGQDIDGLTSKNSTLFNAYNMFRIDTAVQ